ncbi:hypothetical protein FHS39_002596 [Streptomyces olivoverticillatus]|uniref:Uncharacterized protein n=1 Tax=Streptomyces olivoverticillatus TaxID=66427 RepID=A0A7W7LNL8_9ACTN|nr:hypothetical protein [Streptomyces olivoverticillatus]MBB4893565.1 hypothetical protein [Streptomyces olivoverticillatus]
MPGYTNRVILLEFPQLGDKVSVLLRNPVLLPPGELTPDDVATDADGKPVDTQAANTAMYKVMAGLIVAWHVYDASATGVPVAIDLDADDLTAQLAAFETAEQVRLVEITPENVAKLPMAIINRIGEEIGRVADPS